MYNDGQISFEEFKKMFLSEELDKEEAVNND